MPICVLREAQVTSGVETYAGCWVRLGPARQLVLSLLYTHLAALLGRCTLDFQKQQVTSC